MIYSFKNRPLVEVDIIIAVEHYKEINPLLAKQFLTRIRETKKYIALTPLGFQVKYNNVRTVSVK